MLLLGGCASPEPRAEVEAAAALAGERSGAAVDWTDAPAAGAPRALPAGPLAERDSVALALHNHPDLGRELARLAAAKAAWAKAGRLPNPMLDVMVGLPVDGLGGDPWTATLLQPIAWLWTRGPRTERAAAELRAQGLRVAALAVATAAEARTAHARVVFAERGVQLAQRLREVAHAARTVLAERAAVGEASEIERGRAELQALAADDALASAERALAEARQALLLACGVAASGATPVSDGRIATLPEVVLDEERVLALARDRLDVQAAVASAEADAAGARLAERGRLPEVSAGVRFERMEDGREFAFPTLTFVPKVFDGGGADVAQADANARAALWAAEAAWQQAVGALRASLARYAAARAIAVRAREQTLPLAERVAAAAEAAFAAGVLDPQEAFAARLDAVRAEIAADAASLAALQALHELERDAGVRLVTEDGAP